MLDLLNLERFTQEKLLLREMEESQEELESEYQLALVELIKKKSKC
jgi:hypothetical protein